MSTLVSFVFAWGSPTDPPSYPGYEELYSRISLEDAPASPSTSGSPLPQQYYPRSSHQYPTLRAAAHGEGPGHQLVVVD